MKKIIVIALIVIVAALLFYFRDIINVDAMLEFLESVKASPYAPIIFVALYAISVTFLFPASAFTLISGPFFGFWWGLVLTVIASNIGCHMSYFLAKFLGEDFITKRLKSGSFLDAAAKQAQKNGFIFIMYARLIPVFPFGAVNYLSGVIGIKYIHYAIATFFGMLPGTFVYVYLGHSAANIKDNPLAFVVSIVILVVFTAAVLYVKKRNDKKEQAVEE